MEARISDMQSLTNAVSALREQLDEVVQTLIILSDVIAALAGIVAAPRKYQYREDGMPIASEPDLGQ